MVKHKKTIVMEGFKMSKLKIGLVGSMQTLYKNILNLTIELIPSHKIFGFGGESPY